MCDGLVDHLVVYEAFDLGVIVFTPAVDIDLGNAEALHGIAGLERASNEPRCADTAVFSADVPRENVARKIIDDRLNIDFGPIRQFDDRVIQMPGFLQVSP